MDIGHLQGVQHGPEGAELELENFQGAFLLLAGLEVGEGDFQAVLDVPAGEVDVGVAGKAHAGQYMSLAKDFLPGLATDLPQPGRVKEGLAGAGNA